MPIYMTTRKGVPQPVRLAAYGRKPGAAVIIDATQPVAVDDDHDEGTYTQPYVPSPIEPSSSPSPRIAYDPNPPSGVPAPDSGLYVSPRQVDIHKKSETAALWVGVPFLAFMAFSPRLPSWMKIAAGAGAVAAFVVNSGLLATWDALERGEPGPFSENR